MLKLHGGVIWILFSDLKNNVFNSLKPSDVYKLATIGSNNALSPGRHRAIIWTNVGILLTGQMSVKS